MTDRVRRLLLLVLLAGMAGTLAELGLTGHYEDAWQYAPIVLLFLLLQRAFGLPSFMEWNPIYFGAWVGIFATGLNLVPVGQLDGGHAVYALFGSRGHRVASICFYVALTGLALASILIYESPSWLLFLVILSLLAFRRHPPTLESEGSIGL